MDEESRVWKKISGLNEVQVFDDGELVETFTGDDLSVELFDNSPDNNNE
jgi:hypothetical protein